jgi:hypothetical protein
MTPPPARRVVRTNSSAGWPSTACSSAASAALSATALAR